jgi:hypothetical protein
LNPFLEQVSSNGVQYVARCVNAERHEQNNKKKTFGHSTPVGRLQARKLLSSQAAALSSWTAAAPISIALYDAAGAQAAAGCRGRATSA